MRERSATALKEWSSVVEALKSGRQVMLIRKGGLADRGKLFAVEETEFFLYPTYLHQQVEFVRPEFVADFPRGHDAQGPGRQLMMDSYAVVEDAIAVASREELLRLDGLHTWNRRVHRPPAPVEAREPGMGRAATPLPTGRAHCPGGAAPLQRVPLLGEAPRGAAHRRRDRGPLGRPVCRKRRRGKGRPGRRRPYSSAMIQHVLVDFDRTLNDSDAVYEKNMNGFLGLSGHEVLAAVGGDPPGGAGKRAQGAPRGRGASLRADDRPMAAGGAGGGQKGAQEPG